MFALISYSAGPRLRRTPQEERTCKCLTLSVIFSTGTQFAARTSSHPAPCTFCHTPSHDTKVRGMDAVSGGANRIAYCSSQAAAVENAEFAHTRQLQPPATFFPPSHQGQGKLRPNVYLEPIRNAEVAVEAGAGLVVSTKPSVVVLSNAQARNGPAQEEASRKSNDRSYLWLVMMLCCTMDFSPPRDRCPYTDIMPYDAGNIAVPRSR